MMENTSVHDTLESRIFYTFYIFLEEVPLHVVLTSTLFVIQALETVALISLIEFPPTTTILASFYKIVIVILVIRILVPLGE
jgi:hypothetical protein